MKIEVLEVPSPTIFLLLLLIFFILILLILFLLSYQVFTL
nr:MAG TPA: hypothetical protein [Crassvirales sp.]